MDELTELAWAERDRLRDIVRACAESLRLLIAETGEGTAEWSHPQVSLRLADSELKRMDEEDAAFKRLLAVMARD